MSQKFAAVKGMNDLLPGDIEVWQHVERILRETFALYGYQEMRTPVLEDTSLFVRSVGEATDIVGKEMYTFDDKGGRSLSLRPEGTAPAARAYIEHAVQQREPLTRWFYLGPMFRYERMKTGRYRQFWQVGAEAYGAREPAQDAELIDLAVLFLQRLSLTGIVLHVNSLGDEVCRPAYQARLVEHLTAHRAELCADCQTRLERNPLRILDCKNETCRRVAAQAPSVLEFLCADCAGHFEEVKRLLGVLGVPFEVDPRMVRGLDYYTRTAFELIANDPILGTASTVGGGGRYDKLMRALGGPDTPAVGFAMGLDRLVLLLKQAGRTFGERADVFLVAVDAAAMDAVLRLAAALRRDGVSVETDARGGSVKSQMKRADRSGARYALVIGGDEIAAQRGSLKPMGGGDQVPVAFADLARVLRSSR